MEIISGDGNGIYLDCGCGPDYNYIMIDQISMLLNVSSHYPIHICQLRLKHVVLGAVTAILEGGVGGSALASGITLIVLYLCLVDRNRGKDMCLLR